MTSVLDYLEFHVAHHCNLNCKGCGHYSNFVKEEFPCFSQYSEDVSRLKQLADQIQEIRLLGGEPLLNPELPKFIQVIRNAYPDADIRVVTNGLLIPKAEPAVFQMMRNCHVRFDISQYPPVRQCLDKILARCEEESVLFRVSPEVQTFCRFEDTAVPEDAQEIYHNCQLKRCHMMLEGKIAVCPIPILRYKFQAYSWDHMFPEDVIDLYNPVLTGEKLIQLLHQPCRLCAYCGSHNELFAWEGNYRKR